MTIGLLATCMQMRINYPAAKEGSTTLILWTLKNQTMKLKFLLILCLVTPGFCIWFIPGENCGITKEISSLKHLPDDFDGDFSSLSCTIVKASIPEWKFSAWSDCTATCGGGTKHRKTECRDSLGKLYNDLSCGDGYQAQDSSCNQDDCPEPEYTKVVVIKGAISSGVYPLENVEVIDLSSTTTNCQNLTPYPKDTKGRAVSLYKGTIVSCGGGFYDSSTENLKCHSYDPVSQVWVHIGDLQPIPEGSPLAMRATPIGDKLFIAGGLSTNYDRWKDTWLWDGNMLASGPPMAIDHIYMTHCQVAINRTHVFVSESDTITGSADGESFLLESDTYQWTSLAPMPVDAFSGHFFTSCGMAKSDQRGTEVFVVSEGETMVYSLLSDTWRVGPTYQQGSGNGDMAVAQLKYTFLIIKGTSILEYDPAEDSFDLLPQVLSEATTMLSAVAVPDEMATCS